MPPGCLLLQNVDVALTPVQAPTGDDVASCSVTLMPWSPFPCTYNTGTYKGVEGQNQTNYCYSKHTKPDLPGFEFATDLTTDGYSNLFHGVLPDVPCARGFSSSGSSASSPLKQQPSNHVGAAATGQQPGYGLHFSKVLLTVNFRVAAGRQFDRTFSFQIGRAVVSEQSLLAQGVAQCEPADSSCVRLAGLLGQCLDWMVQASFHITKDHDNISLGL